MSCRTRGRSSEVKARERAISPLSCDRSPIGITVVCSVAEAVSAGERGAKIHAKVKRFAQISKSEFCVSCHQVAINLGIKLEVVWEQYRASPEEGGWALPAGARVETPTGFAFPPRDLVPPPPDAWIARAYNCVHRTDLEAGGHFQAQEEPEQLIADIRAFFRRFR